MEIERINENTVKFYISYLDIEDRGFKREEIWYNRERSEQLFWQMMEEINYKEDFSVDGPLWIQVQALEKGLEVTVTRAQVSDSGEPLDLLTGKEFPSISSREQLEEFLDKKLDADGDEIDDFLDEINDNFSLIVKFEEFEDVIQLSLSLDEIVDDTNDRLYHYKDQYYLYIEFPHQIFSDEDQEDIISQILEFSTESDITLHLLEEYGKVIFESQTFSQVKSYFS